MPRAAAQVSPLDKRWAAWAHCISGPGHVSAHLGRQEVDGHQAVLYVGALLGDALGGPDVALADLGQVGPPGQAGQAGGHHARRGQAVQRGLHRACGDTQGGVGGMRGTSRPLRRFSCTAARLGCEHLRDCAAAPATCLCQPAPLARAGDSLDGYWQHKRSLCLTIGHAARCPDCCCCAVLPCSHEGLSQPPQPRGAYPLAQPPARL